MGGGPSGPFPCVCQGATMAQNIVESIISEQQRAKGRQPLPWGLRILCVVFMINIVATLAYLIFSSRDLIAYSGANLIDWVNLVFEAVLLWMVWNRYKVARTFALVFTVLNVVVGTILHIVMKDLDIALQLVSVIPDVIIFCYFFFSKKVQEVLVEEVTFEEPAHEQSMLDMPLKDRFTWPFIRNLIIYFCVFSFLGHWMEMSFCLAIKAGLVGGEYDPSNTMLWRDWFYPFPMHGMAVVLIALLLHPLWRWLVKRTNRFVGSALSFVLNGIACGTIEFICGLMWNADLQNWDYSTMPFNFMGQVCLQNVMGFAFAASIIAWFVYPWLERTLEKLPSNAMNIAFLVVFVPFTVAQTLYLVDPPIDYKAELEYAIAQDDADPTYLTDEERKEYEESLDYLQYLEDYKAENLERLKRERTEQMAAKG